MADKDFLKLIKLRETWFESTKANKFDFSPLLAGQYNDPAHFIYEILQNAEDANAKNIIFILNENSLEINHDGKDFDYKDTDGITGIGISTKKNDINKIGKFGVGFKSVFAITETPRINSGLYNFEIQNFVVPKLLNNRAKKGQTTIILPFNHPKRSKEEIYSLVENKVSDIGMTTLLFLSKIELVEWKSKLKSGKYFKKAKKLSNFENTKKVEVIFENETEKKVEKYLVIQKKINIDGKILKIEVAYKIVKNNEDNEFIAAVEDAKLVVFFPTEKITFLNFLIQGPFKTTPNRENIPFDDEQNIQLIEETADLVAESLSIIKKLGLLNVDFLEILPLREFHSNEIIYKKVFKRIRKEFYSGEALLPTSTGSFSKPEDALLARGKELATFLNKSDINFLYDKKNWLSPEITYDRTKELRDYLIDELDISEVDFSSFSEKISDDFMKRKKDGWVISFYGKLLDRRSLWEKTQWNEGVLRSKPIIRLTVGGHVAPFDSEGKIQVYFPTGTPTKYKTVKETLVKNKKSLEFLKQLGLSKPDLYSEIKEFILPRYLDNSISVNKKYFNDFKKIVETYKKISDDKKNELLEDLKNYPIIACSCINSKKKFLKKPPEVYLDTKELLEYFEGCNGVYFIDGNLKLELLNNLSEEDLQDFLVNIRCNDVPRRTRTETELSYEEKIKLRNNSGYRHDTEIEDHDLEGLDNFLKSITLERSAILWNFLMSYLKKENQVNYNNYFKGKYSWVYRGYTDSAFFDAKFLKKLKQTEWLYNKNNEVKKPVDLSPFELNELFAREIKYFENLTEFLNMIPDPVKLLEEKLGGKFIKNEEYDEYLLLKAEKEKLEEEQQKDSSDKGWQPQVETGLLNPEIIETITMGIMSPKLENRNIDTKERESTADSKEIENIKEKISEPESTEKLKRIGNWGENLVFKALKNRFKSSREIKETKLGFKSFFDDGYTFEIRWLNKISDLGIGYDFVILRDELEIEYIEVKSKVSDKDELIEITGTQWEFARKLYNDGIGDKYYIYVVQNAGNEKANIKAINNPISLWYSGKLYAHPVRFKL